MKDRKPVIAFFGSSLVSSYWNGAATYYRGMIKYLFKQGYKITFYEPDAFERQQHRDLQDPFWAEVVVYPNTMQGVEQALDQAKAADIVIKASGVGVFDDFLEAAVLALKHQRQTVIFWDVNAPATIDKLINEPDSDFRKLVPLYDLIFTYGGGSPVVNAYKWMSAKECIPVYNALDPETHHQVKPDENYIADLSFLGNRLPDREERAKEFFLNVAAAMPERSFILGGSGWGDLTFPSNIRYLNHVYSSDHNVFNSSPLAVLNISRQSMADYGFSPATRLFEAAGAGACIITDEWDGIEHFFTPGEEILVAGSGDEVVSILKSLTREKATEIGQAMKKKVLARHTYLHRATQVDAILMSKQVLQTEYLN